MTTADQRTWLIRWMYLVALGHLLSGMALPWIANLPILEAYHLHLETAFWKTGAPPEARAQQIWWLALIGPTLQCMSLYMAALVRIGEMYRSPFAWGALIAGVVLWAPQDIAIALLANSWVHIWLNTIALVAMLPPLFWLLWQDWRGKPALANGEMAGPT